MFFGSEETVRAKSNSTLGRDVAISKAGVGLSVPAPKPVTRSQWKHGFCSAPVPPKIPITALVPAGARNTN
jgi:hypothetical protein